ncbi:MAG: glycoside hydrolase family 28 protein [Pseudomonadota bacterium]
MSLSGWSRRHVIAALAASGALGACRGMPVAASRPPWDEAEAIARGIQPASIPRRSFPVEPAGPRNRDIRPAILKALEAAVAGGGGRVVVPPGRWLCEGPIHLESRCALHVSKGAHLAFGGDASAYLPVVFTRWEGTEAYNYSPMIYARGVEDVAVTGEGTLDGQGAAHFLPWRERQKPDQNRLRQMGADGVPPEQRVFGAGHFLRPQFVQFVDCERVSVEGVTLVDSPFWCLHPVYCRHVTVRNVRIVSRHINSDGVDPDSSEDVLIEGCEFDTGDDGVAIKAGRDADGWRVGRPTRRVVVRDCRFTGQRGGGMAIGSEMSGGVEDVFVERYAMNAVNHGLYFKANLDRGGLIRNIFIRDIDIERADTVLIFTNDYHSYRGGNAPTRFEDVRVENVRCGQAELGISIVGHPNAPIRRVSVENLRVDRVQSPVDLRHVEALEFTNVRMNGELIAAEETAPGSVDRTLRY